MKHQEDNTKPEGFHTEFRRNVKYIFWIGSVIALVTGTLIVYFS